MDRIPAYARRVVQDDATKNYTAQFWQPAEPFDWRGDNFDASKTGSLLIYEAHVGMAQEREGGRHLPRIHREDPPDHQARRIQRRAAPGHCRAPLLRVVRIPRVEFLRPSRAADPEELKELIRRAHELGLAVIMDLVHAHYVKNLNEGINELDGTDHLYSKPGEAGNQPYWDSKLFDYGKEEVQHFLLSNVKYWLDSTTSTVSASTA